MEQLPLVEEPVCHERVVLFPERDRTKDRALLIDMLIEIFSKTGKFDREKPFGNYYYELDIAQAVFGMPDIPFTSWDGYTREQFEYCRELWAGLGNFFVSWWKEHRP